MRNAPASEPAAGSGVPHPVADWVEGMRNTSSAAARREWDIIAGASQKHRIGFVLPGVVFLVEVVMVFSRIVAGPQEPPSRIRTRRLREDYYRSRAVRIDGLVCSWILLGIVPLWVHPQSRLWNGLLWCLWFCATVNAVAAAIHYGIIEGRPVGTRDRQLPARVFSIPRMIILSLLNYLQVMVWFAAIYASYGLFSVDGAVGAASLRPLDALYFSSMTIFTVGYGDITPVGGIGRLLVILEVFEGTLILAILVGRMLGSARRLGEYADRSRGSRGGGDTRGDRWARDDRQHRSLQAKVKKKKAAGHSRRGKMLTYDELWARIVAHRGETFRQIRGGEFRYAIRGSAVFPDRTNRHIYRKNFEKALDRMPFDKTTVLQDLQGPSYVFAIMTDPRICG